MQIITSPSKTQQFNGRAYDTYTLPLLQQKTKVLIDQLQLLDRKKLSHLMQTSARLTESTYRMISNFSQPLSMKNSTQALFTFQGDAYKMIDAKNYTKEQLLYAQNHLFILSGLYGLLRPLDLMQPYRLEMGCRFAAGNAENLYQFWRETLTDLVNQDLALKSDRVLVNLASKEYSAVIDNKKILGEMVTIIFKQMHKGQLRIIPIHAKRARGLMIHFAISKQIDTAAGLKEFTGDNYSFASRDSTAKEWIFVKQEES